MPDKLPNAIKILQRCGRCSGTGEVDQIEGVGEDQVEGPIVECDLCGGTGYREMFQIDMSDVLDRLDDIMDKCNDIFEKVNG